MNIQDFEIIQAYPILNDPEVLPLLPNHLKNSCPALQALNAALTAIKTHPQYRDHWHLAAFPKERNEFMLAADLIDRRPHAHTFERFDIVLELDRLHIVTAKTRVIFPLSRLSEIKELIAGISASR